jgi:hypothetical protein
MKKAARQGKIQSCAGAAVHASQNIPTANEIAPNAIGGKRASGFELTQFASQILL